MPGSSKWEHVVIPYFFHSQTAGRSREGSYPAIAGVEDAGNVRRFQLAPPDSDEQPHGIADHLFEKAVRFKAPGQFEAAFGERALGVRVMDRMVRTRCAEIRPAFFRLAKSRLPRR